MHCWGLVVAKAGRAVPPSARAVLDDHDPDDLFFKADNHVRWQCEDGRVEVAGWTVGDGHLGVGSRWALGEDGATWFSGHVWISASPWASGRSWAEQLSDHFRRRRIEDEVERLDGVFTLGRLDRDGHGWITADPLGAGMVYRAENADVVVFTNRASLAAALITAPGGRAERDAEAMGLLGYTGTLQGDRTGYRAVRVIPQASIVRLAPGRAPEVRPWSALPWWSDAARTDPESAVRAAIEQLRARTHVAATLPVPRLRSELTGGRDSRLVLALLLATDHARDVQFQTWGGPTLPDVQVATELAHQYGLQLVASGTLAVPGNPRPPRTDVDRPPLARWQVRRGLSYEEEIRHHVWAAGAGLSVWDLRPVSWPPAINGSLSGLFGETLRTNYPRSDSVVTEAELRRFLDGGGLGYDPVGLLTPEAAELARRAVERDVLDLLPEGGDARDAIDGFYQRGRARRWAGMRQELDARNRLFPLYDLTAMRAAFAIGADARRNEALPLRILEACAPDLARLPFAGPGWPTELVAGLDEPGAYPTRPPRTPWEPPSPAPSVRRRRWWSRGGRDEEPLPRRTDAASSSVAAQGRMQAMEDKRAVLRQHLDLPPDHAVWEVFDRRRTLRALDEIELLPDRGRGQVHDAVTAAMWLSGSEAKAEVFVPVEPDRAGGSAPRG